MDNICNAYPPPVVRLLEPYHRYRCEGMSDLIVYHHPVQLNAQHLQEAERRLQYLLENMGRLVSLQQIRQTFSLVNALVANPLGKDEFEFKVNVIFTVFADRPACLFQAHTSKALATCSRFFPSGLEIKQIVDQQEQAYRQEIETLKGRIARTSSAACSTSVDNISLHDVQNERVFQRNLKKLRQIFSPLDDLGAKIKEHIDSIVPKQGFPSNLSELIEYLQRLCQELQDRQLIVMIEERVHALEQVERQLKQLNALGLL